MFSDQTTEDLNDDSELPDDNSFHVGLRPAIRSTSEVLAEIALDAALNSRSRRILQTPSRLSIVHAPSKDWVGPIGTVLEQSSGKPIVATETERRRSGGGMVRVGTDALTWLQKGKPLVYVCQNPDEILDESILIAAELTIVIPPLTPALLSKAIRRITKGVARGVTAEMAELAFAVIASVIRPGLSARDCVVGLQRAVAKVSARRETSGTSSVPLLTDLPLTRAMRTWTDQVLSDLDKVKRGEMSPDALIFAALEGPPGTGKTLIAESLARTADWAFVPSSVGAWFTSGDGALGGVAKNVKSFVDQVLASEPAIGFLDELDAIPSRETMDNKDRGWWTPIITLVLTEVDRLRKSQKRVMLIGATNFYARLDPALIRPGRMQQRVSVLPPEIDQEVIDVLRYYLGDALGTNDLAKIGRVGRGATPAAIEGWVKEARALARAEHRAVTETDILTQMLPRDERNAADIRAAAIHEIGHAVVALRIGHEVKGVSIIPEGQTGGLTMSRLPSLVPSWEQVCDAVTVALGGRAADIVVGKGAHAGAEADLDSATMILRAAIERQGLGNSLVYVPNIGAGSVDLRKAIDEQLQTLLRRAIVIVEADRVLVLKLADRLVAEKMLTGAEITEVLGEEATSTRKELRNEGEGVKPP